MKQPENINARPVTMPSAPEPNQIEAAISHLPDMNPAHARRVLKAIYETFIDMRPENLQPRNLTKKMAQLLDVLKEYEEEHGYSPTRDELAAMIGIDRKGIYNRLNALRKRGYLLIRPGHRGIVIIKRN